MHTSEASVHACSLRLAQSSKRSFPDNPMEYQRARQIGHRNVPDAVVWLWALRRSFLRHRSNLIQLLEQVQNLAGFGNLPRYTPLSARYALSALQQIGSAHRHITPGLDDCLSNVPKLIFRAWLLSVRYKTRYRILLVAMTCPRHPAAQEVCLALHTVWSQRTDCSEVDFSWQSFTPALSCVTSTLQRPMRL